MPVCLQFEEMIKAYFTILVADKISLRFEKKLFI